MKVNKLFLWVIGFCVVTFMSCIKEYSTDYKGIIKNATSRSIKILPFIYGKVSPNDTIVLQEGDSFVIAQGYFKGNVTAPGFVSNKFEGPVDSCYTIFDDTFVIVDYTNLMPTVFPSKYYLFENPRNFWNSKNYIFSRIKISKHHYLNYHQFLFSEQDYQYAKE